MVKNLCILFFLFVSLVCSGQDFFIVYHGVVTDYYTGKPIRNALVQIDWEGGSESVVTKKSGVYTLFLEKGIYYYASYAKKGLVTKRMEIDATNIPDTTYIPYYDMFLQITLFEDIDSVDFSIFDEPIGRAEYKPSVRTLNWDNEFSKEQKVEASKTMNRYHKAFVGYGERSTKKPIVIADSTLVFNEDESDNIVMDNALNNFKSSDSLSAYYMGEDVAPAKQVETIVGLFFTVQVGVYSKPTKLSELYNISPLNSELMDDKRIRYTSGQFGTMDEAGEYKRKIVMKGVKDAFVVAYFNGKRIPLEDAIYLKGKFGEKLYQQKK